MVKNHYLPFLRVSETSGVKKIFFKISKCQNADYRPTVKNIFLEPDFFWTWNFQGWFLSLLSTIFESFSKIVSVVLNYQNLRYHFWQLWLPGEIFNFWRRIFLDLKFSGIVPSNIIYHFWEFQKYLGSKRFSKKFLSVKMHTVKKN